MLNVFIYHKYNMSNFVLYHLLNIMYIIKSK